MAITLNGSSSVVTNSGAVYDGIQRGTAVTASGTSVDFTSIPSWVKRITVMFNGVSTSGTSLIQVQIGSGSVSTTGYIGTASYSNQVGGFAASTTGFIVDTSGTAQAAYTRAGVLSLYLISSTTWIASGVMGTNTTAQQGVACGGSSPALSGALDRVRITTVNGTDIFDAGSINILYE